jgi:proteasome assembly chaperone (PAC2) family protein
MSQIIQWEHPSLTRPILITAFAGWNDAGRSATMAVEHLVETWKAAKFAEIDPDEFFDFTASRPWVKLDESGRSELSWPSNTFYAHRDPSGSLDAVLLLGTEPGLRWQGFVREIVGLARSLGVSMAVTLGSHLAPVSHREETPVSGWAWPRSLHRRLGEIDVSSITYSGPTGIVTVLGKALADARIPVAALWASVPAYLGPTANPKAALALVRRLDRAFGLGLDLGQLERTSERFERSVEEAVQRVHAMPGIALYQAQRGEKQTPQANGSAASAEDPSSSPELPPADEVVRAVEEFLRQKRQK